MFVNNHGLLDIDSIILNNESYQKIMEDGVITKEEIQGQLSKVENMLTDMKGKYSEEQFKEIQQLIAEVTVLLVINQ